MKTFNCWLIANVLPYVVAISCYFAIGGLGLRMNCFSFWDYFVVFGCGGIFSIIVMIYTYCNIEEVLSCRFIWGNSNVSIFSFSLRNISVPFTWGNLFFHPSFFNGG